MEAFCFEYSIVASFVKTFGQAIAIGVFEVSPDLLQFLVLVTIYLLELHRFIECMNF